MRYISSLATFVGLAAVLAAPLGVWAAEFHTGDQVRLTQEAAIGENVYAAGGEVVISTPVEGDLFAAGGNVRITEPVRDDLFVAGGDIEIEGAVGGDVRVAGGNVRLEGPIGGDLLVSGGNVELTEEASVAGETYAGAGRLLIAGSMQRLEAGVGELVLESSARINGDVIYTSETDANIADGAVVEGDVTRREVPVDTRQAQRGLLFFFTGAGIVWLLASLIILLAFVWGLPGKAAAVATDWRTHFGINLLWGLAILVLTPIVIIMLLVSVVGIPIAILLFIVYLLFIFMAKLVTVVAIGRYVASILGQSTWSLPLSVLVGFVMVIVVSVVPVIGGLILFIAFLAGMGALARYDVGLYKRLRERGDF